MDETGIPKVLKPLKVHTKNDLKQVQQTVSKGRCVNITILAFICPSGTNILPVFIISQKRVLPTLAKHGSRDCLDLVQSSGWINGETFLLSLIHFFEFTESSKEGTHFLFLYNHIAVIWR